MDVDVREYILETIRHERALTDTQIEHIEEATRLVAKNMKSEFQLLLNDVQSLKEFRSSCQGSASQASVHRTQVIAIISLAIGVIGLIWGFIK
jgi:hypothetical protein